MARQLHAWPGAPQAQTCRSVTRGQQESMIVIKVGLHEAADLDDLAADLTDTTPDDDEDTDPTGM